MEPHMSDLAFDYDNIRANLESMAQPLDLHPPGTVRPVPSDEPSLSELRRGRRPGPRRGVLALSLVERQGLVYWEIGAPVRPELRRTRRAGGIFGKLIARKEVTELEPNQVTQYLEQLDSTLTPKRGIRKWTVNGLVDCTQFPADGNILLFVHGTFSNSDHLFSEINAAPNGSQFLNRALSSYNHVLAFDHPTLSVSPVVNAVDLRAAVGDSKANIDIVCHSRGGLVSRWWMEKLDPCSARVRRAVFVGSPLTGTSLASPARLRAGLKLMSTYASLLGNA